MDEEYQVSKIFEELYIPNYDVVDKQLNKKEMTLEENEGYLIRKVVKLHLQLRRIRGQVTQYNKGNTNFAEKQWKFKQADDARIVSKQYVEPWLYKYAWNDGSFGIWKKENQMLQKIENCDNHGRKSCWKLRNMVAALMDALLKAIILN